MTLPLTRPCPECGADMELLVSDDAGAVVLYECTECGFQTQEVVDEEFEEPTDEELDEDLEDEELEEDEEEEELEEDWEEEEEEEELPFEEEDLDEDEEWS